MESKNNANYLLQLWNRSGLWVNNEKLSVRNDRSKASRCQQVNDEQNYANSETSLIVRGKKHIIQCPTFGWGKLKAGRQEVAVWRRRTWRLKRAWSTAIKATLSGHSHTKTRLSSAWSRISRDSYDFFQTIFLHIQRVFWCKRRLQKQPQFQIQSLIRGTHTQSLDLAAIL